MQEATLLFLLKEDKVLLAMKKRGYGLGKWNGVGGKVEPFESVSDAVVRECQEEIGVTPYAPEEIGVLYIVSRDHAGAPPSGVRVFTSARWHGRPVESEEMRPRWFKREAIPYENMWPTDQYWLPYLLRGEHFIAHIGEGQEILLESSASVQPDAILMD